MQDFGVVLPPPPVGLHFPPSQEQATTVCFSHVDQPKSVHVGGKAFVVVVSGKAFVGVVTLVSL
jgi:hypothetical protein